ncbi:MAG: flavodoxin family protein [Verrucomicrobiota bacterium]
MKVIAFNGSPRPDGNTFHLLQHVFQELHKEGIETELINLGTVPIRGCRACYHCFETRDAQCSMKHDIVNESIAKMLAADGVILASPTYFANVTAEMKAFIDRAGLVAKANGGHFRRKVGAAVVAVRRGGEMQVFNALNSFFLISEMIVPGSCYWNMGFGLDKGQVENDEEGVRTMHVLGQNMAWLLKTIHG